MGHENRTDTVTKLTRTPRVISLNSEMRVLLHTDVKYLRAYSPDSFLEAVSSNAMVPTSPL